MNHNPLTFFVELLRQPLWVAVWVGYLMIINMAALAFWAEPLAQLIFVTFMASALLMMGLFAHFGFAKILGLGHVFWLPLSVYLATSLPTYEGAFHLYLWVLLISILVSLAFDIYDVWQYFCGKQTS